MVYKDKDEAAVRWQTPPKLYSKPTVSSTTKTKSSPTKSATSKKPSKVSKKASSTVRRSKLDKPYYLSFKYKD